MSRGQKTLKIHKNKKGSYFFSLTDFFSPVNWPDSSNRSHCHLAGGYRRDAFEGQRVWEGIPEGKTYRGVLIPCVCLHVSQPNPEHTQLTPTRARGSNTHKRTWTHRLHHTRLTAFYSRTSQKGGNRTEIQYSLQNV